MKLDLNEFSNLTEEFLLTQGHSYCNKTSLKIVNLEKIPFKG